jgi:carbonic anhydrase/acetyltransferase-like protein (isoleucine patch superfamily)
MSIYKLIPYNNIIPKIDNDAYIADGTIIIGSVDIGKNSSIWFNSVLRGDVAPIVIGENSNIQDGTVIHTSRFNGPVMIGSNVTIGHMALIHAASIANYAFIGMRSIIMDFAIIEEYGFVAAGSLVSPHKIIKSKELWMGIPAKFIRFVTDKELEQMEDNNRSYIELAKSYSKKQ